MVKERRHHNNKGHKSIKNGTVERAVRKMAKRLGIPYYKSSLESAPAVDRANPPAEDKEQK